MQNEKRNKEPTSNKPFPNGGRENSRYLPYNKKLKQYSRNLRNNSTRAEITLWNELRAAQLGYTFNRQKPLQKFIVDFYCKPLHLVIEVDGITHWDKEQIKQDKIRQTILEKIDLHFLRFDDDEVLHDTENVLRTIEITIEKLEKFYPEAIKRRKNSPSPLKRENRHPINKKK